jgi:hypothetical protein
VSLPVKSGAVYRVTVGRRGGSGGSRPTEPAAAPARARATAEMPPGSRSTPSRTLLTGPQAVRPPTRRPRDLAGPAVTASPTTRPFRLIRTGLGGDGLAGTGPTGRSVDFADFSTGFGGRAARPRRARATAAAAAEEEATRVRRRGGTLGTDRNSASAGAGGGGGSRYAVSSGSSSRLFQSGPPRQRVGHHHLHEAHRLSTFPNTIER